MESIIFSKKPKLKNPCLIVAWPGMGEVAFKAATYLIEKLKAQELAEIPPQDFFYLTGSVIEAGILNLPALPYGKFYYWKRPAVKRSGATKATSQKNETSDLIIFVSDAQPDLTKAEEYCAIIMKLAKLYKTKMVISFAAMPQPIEHTQNPGVWLAATHKELSEVINKQHAMQLLSEGQISGLNGLFLGMAKREGFNGFCLLGEVPLYTIQVENPRASYAVLEALNKIINLDIDFSDLLEQAHNMEEQINKLLEFLKVGPSPIAPIGEEEIEKIKKTLSQLTKLPVSVKEKIEKLFIEAKTDIAKAHQLKDELDKWNVYREYEDRFLDLFKKKKEQNN